MKIIKSLEDAVLLTKGCRTIKNETKEQKGGFLRYIRCLLGNLLTGERLKWPKSSNIPEQEV